MAEAEEAEDMKAIVVAVDNTYADYARLTVHDAWAYSGKQYPVYIFYDDTLSHDNAMRIEKMRNKYGIDVCWWRIDRLSSFYKDLPRDHHVSPIAYSKLLMGELLWEGVKTAYYIDIDTLVLRDLTELFSIEPEKAICVADHGSEEDYFRLYKEPGRYINTGVIVANLARWNSMNVMSRVKQTIDEYGNRLRWAEQDIMMNVFKDEWEKLPIEYNFMLHGRFNPLVKNNGDLDWDPSEVDPAILHFIGPSKPWGDKNDKNTHRMWRRRITLL